MFPNSGWTSGASITASPENTTVRDGVWRWVPYTGVLRGRRLEVTLGRGHGIDAKVPLLAVVAGCPVFILTSLRIDQQRRQQVAVSASMSQRSCRQLQLGTLEGAATWNQTWACKHCAGRHGGHLGHN